MCKFWIYAKQRDFFFPFAKNNKSELANYKVPDIECKKRKEEKKKSAGKKNDEELSNNQF